MKKHIFLLSLFFHIPSNAMKGPCMIALFNATRNPVCFQLPELKPSQNSPNLPCEPRVDALGNEMSIPPFKSYLIAYPTDAPLRMVSLPKNILTFYANGRYIVWIAGNPPTAHFIGQQRKPLDWNFNPNKQSPKDIESFNFLFSSESDDFLLTFEEMFQHCQDCLENKRLMVGSQEKWWAR